jgi:hypothetical protein
LTSTAVPRGQIADSRPGLSGRERPGTCSYSRGCDWPTSTSSACFGL